jgi:L-threonylcarbamoyladenylate synthase
MGADAVKASERLYDLLRKLDEAKAKYIYSETFDERDIGYALMNRMLKAAGHRVVEV